MPTRALLIALGICAGAIALEGVFAGPGVKQRMAELKRPAYSPPFVGWILIGLWYYVACFVVIVRLLTIRSRSPGVPGALVIVVILMAVNAFWNYFFFRQRNLRASLILSVPYSILALVLAGLLFQLDSLAAWVFLPYAVYLGYAGWWGYRLWRLNPS